MVRAALVIVLALVAQIAPPRRIAATPEQTGPGRVSKTMSSLDVQTFATALAKAGHAAGFVMPNAEAQAMLPADSGETLTLDEAVTNFTARGRYKAVKYGNVTVFHHVRTPEVVRDALEIPKQHYPIKGTFSLALYDIVLRGLARRPTARVTGKEPGASADCPVEQTISIPAGRSTPIQTMNALVSRVNGVAWLVRFGERGDPLRLQVGYVCGNGVWSALSVPGW